MRLVTLGLLLLGLSGCAHEVSGVLPNKIVTVKVPVPISCVPDDWQPAPAGRLTKEQLQSSTEPADMLLKLGAYWIVYDSYLKQDEAVIAACRAVKPLEPVK